MAIQLSNKVILITGASSGIGEACARQGASQGAKLILAARREERLHQLKNQLHDEFHVEIHTVTMDVRDQERVQHCLENLPEDWQSIDILINNAGLALGSDPIQQGIIEYWNTMIDTNIKGLLYVSHAVLPGMIARNSGHIINIGSIAGHECYTNGNVYCASKHAVNALSKSMRLDLLGTAIRVSEISPGAVETEFSEVRWKNKEKAELFYKDFDPLLAHDIAEAVFFCLTRPPHVDIAEMIIMPTVQASANHLSKRGKLFVKE